MRDRKNAPDFPRNRPGVLVASEVHVQQQAEEKPKSSFSGRGKRIHFIHLCTHPIYYLFSPEIKRQHTVPLVPPKQGSAPPLGHLGPAGSSERRLHEGSKACFRMKGSLIGASRDTPRMKGWMGRNTSAGRRLAAYATDRTHRGTGYAVRDLPKPYTLFPSDRRGNKNPGFSGGGLYYEIGVRERNLNE